MSWSSDHGLIQLIPKPHIPFTPRREKKKTILANLKINSPKLNRGEAKLQATEICAPMCIERKGSWWFLFISFVLPVWTWDLPKVQSYGWKCWNPILQCYRNFGILYTIRHHQTIYYKGLIWNSIVIFLEEGHFSFGREFHACELNRFWPRTKLIVVYFDPWLLYNLHIRACNYICMPASFSLGAAVLNGW